MKVVRQQWLKLNERYVALSRRERLILAAALILAPLLLGDTLILEPLRTQAKVAEKNLALQSSSLAELRAQVVSLQQQVQHNPDTAPGAELATLVAEQQRLDDELRRLSATLVRPDEMNGLLEGLLARQAGLRLISLKTLAPRSVLAERTVNLDKAADAKGSERQFDLYRHGVELRLEGNYADLQAYLLQLEQLKQRLLWGKLQYKVIEYPIAEMNITVYTLSADRAWLAI